MNSPIPEERAVERQRKSVYSFCHSLQYPYCWNTQFPKENTTSSPPLYTDSKQLGARLIWTTPWCDGSNTSSVHTLDSGTAGLRESIPDPASITTLTTFIRKGKTVPQHYYSWGGWQKPTLWVVDPFWIKDTYRDTHTHTKMTAAAAYYLFIGVDVNSGFGHFIDHLERS